MRQALLRRFLAMTSFAPPRQLPETVLELERGISDGLHLGAQIHVSLAGREVASFAVGSAGPSLGDAPMRTDMLLPWWSSTKPLTAIAIGQQIDAGRMRLSDPVAKFVPEFAQNGKGGVTLEHVLLHTAGFPKAGLDAPPVDRGAEACWEDTLAKTCSATLESPPGHECAYHIRGGWHVLGQAVLAASGYSGSYGSYLRENVLQPLGAVDSFVGMPAAAFARYRDEGRLAPLYFLPSANASLPIRAEAGAVSSAAAAQVCSPGGGGCGPAAQLVKPFELLAGVSTAPDVLSPETAALLRAARRTGMFDTLQGATIDWSLAGPVDCVLFGRHCSREAFGHGGSQSSMVMADPAHGLALAVICNGKCGGPQHNARMGRIAAAVYADLGISGTGDAARHEMPSYG